VDYAISRGHPDNPGIHRRGNSIPENYPRDIKNNEIKPRQNKAWRIPPKANAEFAACVEDVLLVDEDFPSDSGPKPRELHENA
jgi:hypothetical protein